MKVYLRTSRARAEAILATGFSGRVRLSRLPTGRGQVTLEVDLPEEALEPHRNKGQGWTVPAEVLNRLARFRFAG
ncbi:MAG: hypothetical protein AMXMBFR33_61390 [Candidatus Xenobia bacterium]|jgi:hypothetical protein